MDILFSDGDADLRMCRWHICNSYAYRHKPGTHEGKEAAHRIVLERMMRRELEKGELSDHINRNKLDNRRDNLRLTDVSGNGQNRKPSLSRGTTFHKLARKWQAQVKYCGKTFYLGLFETQMEASEAAKQKRKELRFLGEA